MYYIPKMANRLPDALAVVRRNLQHALRNGRLQEAEEALSRLQREDPLAVQTRGLELELLLRQNRLAEAHLLAEQLVETFPASARIHYLAGRAAYRNKVYDRAEDHLRESLRIAQHWKTRQWLGKAMTQVGKFAEAEPLLIEVVEEHPLAGRDLGWLYERMGEHDRAIEVLERYLETASDDDFVAQQLHRLRALAMDPADLMGEIDALLALGETVPIEIFPETVKTLVEQGDLVRAKALVDMVDVVEHASQVTRAAWHCHRAHVPDLAYELFTATFEHNQHSPKFLTALEADAGRAGKIPALVKIYRSRAKANPKLWGRAITLEKRLEDG